MRNRKLTIEKEVYLFAKHYSILSDICKKFVTTFSGRSTNYETDPVFIFCFMCLDNLKLETRSISTLIDKKLYNQSISHVRNIFELFINLNWIYDSDEDNRVENVTKLESTTYYWQEKEVNVIENDLDSKEPVWTREVVNDMRESLATVKAKYPNLLKDNKDFKQAPSLPDRMSKTIRLKYYHIYKFLSMFVHPSPFFRDLHFKKVVNGKEPIEIIGAQLLEMLTYGLWLTYLSFLGFPTIFNNDKLKGFRKREECIKSMYNLFNDVNKSYINLSK